MYVSVHMYICLQVVSFHSVLYFKDLPMLTYVPLVFKILALGCFQFFYSYVYCCTENTSTY